MNVYSIESPLLRARIAARGAALAGLWRAGWGPSVVLGSDDPARFMDAHPYAGTVVGPIANRVGGARMTLAGRTCALPANEPPNSLHSGPDGLHARVWELKEHAPDAVTLGIELADGDCGLPGRRSITARFALGGDTLWVTLCAVSDADTAMNLALHPYWNLTGQRDLSRHRLWLAAERYLPVGADHLPTGHVAPLRDLGLAPHRPSPLGTARPLDHNICLAPGPRRAPMFAARLDAPTGPRLHLRTTAPGLQVYDGRSLPAIPGTPIGPGAGLALEPQMWPDAPNHSAFPLIDPRARERFEQVTAYRLELT